MKSILFKKNTILASVAGVIGVSIYSKTIAYLSSLLLAYKMGTSYVSDAYYTIYSVHSVIYPMLSIGVWKVFMPYYKGLLVEGEFIKAKKLADWFITKSTIFIIITIVVSFHFMDNIVDLIAPGFDELTKKLAVDLVRVSLPGYILTIITACLASILQSHNFVVLSQVKLLVNYIPTIIYCVFFFDSYGVYGMAVAFFLDSVARFLITLVVCRKVYRFNVCFINNIENRDAILKALPSSFASAACTEVNATVDKIMASKISVGALSGLNYGQKLFNVFSGLLSEALGTVVYPRFISLAKSGEINSLQSLTNKIDLLMLTFTGPIALVCYIYRLEIVKFVFERGAFDYKSVVLTSDAFAYYMIGLYFYSSASILVNVIYGCKETKAVLIITAKAMLINVSLNLILSRYFGLAGLATATSIANALYYTMIRYKIAKIFHIDFYDSFSTKEFMKTISAIIIMWFLVGGARIVFLDFNRFYLLLLYLIIQSFIYIFILYLLRQSVIIDIIEKIKSSIKL